MDGLPRSFFQGIEDSMGRLCEIVGASNKDEAIEYIDVYANSISEIALKYVHSLADGYKRIINQVET